MTRDSDFKTLVRERMARTGQSYTAARADLMAETEAATPPPQTHAPSRAEDTAWERAAREQRRVVGRFFDGERLRSIPVRRKVRAAILLELVSWFQPGRGYPEPEVNEILGRAHEDHAYLRRELVNYGYLQRADGIYRLPERAPVRGAFHAQEIPDWEALWLPRHLNRPQTYPG